MSDNSFVVIILIIKTFRHFFEYILQKIHKTNNLNPDIYGNTGICALISNYYITIKTDVDHKIKMLRRDHYVSFRVERIVIFYNKTRTKEQQVGTGEKATILLPGEMNLVRMELSRRRTVVNTNFQKWQNFGACLVCIRSWSSLPQFVVTSRPKQCMLEIGIDSDYIIEPHGSVLIFWLTTENFIDRIPSGCCCSR